VILAFIVPRGIRTFWRSCKVVAGMVFYGDNAGRSYEAIETAGDGGER
jgi:hypothetical protein